MSSDSTLKIVGTINSEEDLDALVDAIVTDQAAVDWAPRGVDDEDDARELVLESLRSGNPLMFAENDRSDDMFPHVQGTCEDIGLSYVLENGVDEAQEDAGRTVVYVAETKKELTFVGSSLGDGPLLRPKGILPLVEAGKLDELAALVRLAADPEAILPKSLSAGFDLELKTFPAP